MASLPVAQQEAPRALVRCSDTADCLSKLLEATACGLDSRNLEAPGGYKLLGKAKSKPGEMAWPLRELVAFTEDLGSIPITQ